MAILFVDLMKVVCENNCPPLSKHFSLDWQGSSASKNTCFSAESESVILNVVKKIFELYF